MESSVLAKLEKQYVLQQEQQHSHVYKLVKNRRISLKTSFIPDGGASLSGERALQSSIDMPTSGSEPECYELLGLDPASSRTALSAQDIKHAYKRALLRYHPVKVAGASTPARSSASGPTVDEISLAYKTLSDPNLRAEYDRLLSQSSLDQRSDLGGDRQHIGLEIVDLDSLIFHTVPGTWSRSCRCGDTNGFVVTEDELEKHVQDGELTVGCKGCSLWLRVLFGVEE